MQNQLSRKCNFRLGNFRFGTPLLATVCFALATPTFANENRIDTIRPDAPELAQYGKFAVGVKTLKLVNPKQLDIVKAKAGEPTPTYDRPLTVEVWYPATSSAPSSLAASSSATSAAPGQYRVVSRDPKTEVTLIGKGVRDAQPDPAGGPYPLLIVSHGYPGNRFLLSHLCENLASKGYIVASIDHTDSTYSDQAAFGSTLFNRPLDQLFVLNEIAKLNAGDAGDGLKGVLKNMVNANMTGLIGYSMGGYGVMNVIGAGLSPSAATHSMAPPNSVLAARQTGNPTYGSTRDARIKAAVTFAPWGWTRGFFDNASLAEVKTPLLVIGGSVDDVSGYSPGVRNFYEGSINAPRYLLTFENANHNAGAPMPAPKESYARVPNLPVIPAMHYIDPVWDNVRMNNIAQHFVTAFLAKQLKGDSNMDAYLNLVENAKDGKWSVEADGKFKADHTYWKGFPNRTAAGLKFEGKGR